MAERRSFDYALIRVVPHVEREEFINVGVIVFCREKRYLGIRVALDVERLTALAPDLVAAEVQDHLDVFARVANGDAVGGPIAVLPAPSRFHWLVSPRSTVIQTSAVHSGLTDDPATELNRLFERMILKVSPEGSPPSAQ